MREEIMSLLLRKARDKSVRTKKNVKDKKMSEETVLAVKRFAMLANALGAYDVSEMAVVRDMLDVSPSEAEERLKKIYDFEVVLPLEAAKKIFGENIFDDKSVDEYVLGTHAGASRMKAKATGKDDKVVGIRIWMSTQPRTKNGKKINTIVESKPDDELDLYSGVTLDDAKAVTSGLVELFKSTGAEIPEDFDMDGLAEELYNQFTTKIETVKEGIRKTDLHDFKSIDDALKALTPWVFETSENNEDSEEAGGEEAPAEPEEEKVEKPSRRTKRGE